MGIKGLRNVESYMIRAEGGAAMSPGIAVRYNNTVDGDSNVPQVIAATSGGAKCVGILLDNVIARPAEAEDSTDVALAGIIGDWAFTSATPLFQEAGDRYVGEEVSVMRRGLISTNMLQGTPSGGLLAFVTVNGYITAHAAGTGIGQPIGVWQSATGTDGYAQLYVNFIPTNAEVV